MPVEQVTFTDLPPASTLYDADLIPLDQNGGDGYTKASRFDTLYTSISSNILVNTRNRLKSVESRSTLLLPLSGGVVTGSLSIINTPTSPLHAANKSYVDTFTTVNASLTASNRAWVAFDATRNWLGSTDNNNSQRYIYSSFNVLCASKVSDGQFKITFSNTALTINNYAVMCDTLSPSIISLSGNPIAASASVTTMSSTFVTLSTVTSIVGALSTTAPSYTSSPALTSVAAVMSTFTVMSGYEFTNPGYISITCLGY
jgi:hypothetical protein